jgi:hypothetical protein
MPSILPYLELIEDNYEEQINDLIAHVVATVVENIIEDLDHEVTEEQELLISNAVYLKVHE